MAVKSEHSNYLRKCLPGSGDHVMKSVMFLQCCPLSALWLDDDVMTLQKLKLRKEAPPIRLIGPGVL